METTEKQPVVFAYYKDGKLMGFRADTFGTLSQKHPKIYSYSAHQVDVILHNTRAELNHTGSSLLKKILEQSDVIVMTREGQLVEDESAVEDVAKSITDRVSNQENEKREWGEFELHVIPFLSKEDDDYPEQWKIDAEIANLKPALEVHKFSTIQNEN